MKNLKVKKTLILLSLIPFFFSSCFFIHRGEYVNGHCRPKRTNFKLSKTPFKKTDDLKFNLVYIADNYTKSSGLVFLPDGRMIYLYSKQSLELKMEDVFGINWANADFIGYWRTENNRIEIEYFVCGDSGSYIKKNGEIKKDTLIFERYFGTPNPFKRINRPEKYKISNFSIK